ncbi:hypothetical protein Goklo_004681 [Gossypium klotzschianum]|uniref:RNase H type-1 domain-containing protein n=1 Tax=Gossypium klotzschianum TaxID=34286 RepID=A0A7J8VQ37_9ROSI|nr:hypothetical protein [Gossypium klotzschianum]
MTTGMANTFQIEARAVLEGIQLAWEKGFRQVKVESDNVMLIKSLQDGLAVLKFRHIHRSNNKVADCLAKEAEGDLDRHLVLEEPSVSVQEFLEEISLCLLEVTRNT